jgi:hypothetical protein
MMFVRKQRNKSKQDTNKAEKGMTTSVVVAKLNMPLERAHLVKELKKLVHEIQVNLKNMYEV